jgi:hypothetical protein
VVLPTGMPENAVTIHNSSRLDGACPRRWFFRYPEALEPETEARPLSYGTAWHRLLEEVHTWWMRRSGAPWPADGGERCPWCAGDGCEQSCGGTGWGVVRRQEVAWMGSEREGDGEVLRGNLEGWLHVHGDRPPYGLRVVGVEVPLAMPVPRQSGSTYRTEVYTVHAPDGRWRRARTGEAAGWPLVDPSRLPPGCKVDLQVRPVYLSVRLDVVWAELDAPALWVGELKTSQSPEGYLRRLTIDPQLPCYELALDHAVQAGLLSAPGALWAGGVTPGWRVAGWRYDVTSSLVLRDPAENQPEKVKALGPDGQPYKVKGKWAYMLGPDGEPITRPVLSRSSTLLASVPSWRLSAAVDRLGLPRDEWVDQIAEQVHRVDQARFKRESNASGPDVKARALRELYSTARQHAAMWRAAALARTEWDVDTAFPAIPICRHGGVSCPFSGPCAWDGPYAREGLRTRDPLRGDEPGHHDVPQAWEDPDDAPIF